MLSHRCSNPKSSCQDLIRASTPFLVARKNVDGRAKPTAVRFRFLHNEKESPTTATPLSVVMAGPAEGREPPIHPLRCPKKDIDGSRRIPSDPAPSIPFAL